MSGTCMRSRAGPAVRSNSAETGRDVRACRSTVEVVARHGLRWPEGSSKSAKSASTRSGALATG